MLRVSASGQEGQSWDIDSRTAQRSRVLTDCLRECTSQRVCIPFAEDVVRAWLLGERLERDILFRLEFVEVRPLYGILGLDSAKIGVECHLLCTFPVPLLHTAAMRCFRTMPHAVRDLSYGYRDDVTAVQAE